MLLAVDAGNSFVKLAYHDGSQWLGVERVALSGFAAKAAAWEGPRPDVVWVSDVAGPAFRDSLAGLVRSWACPVRWVRPSERCCGVVNGYRRPSQLGSDRWCALVAAHRLGGEAKVVASVGTAVTVDGLTADGVFLGGLILPGIALMQAVLAAHTAGVGETRGSHEVFPRDTGNGVYTGALAGIAGAVERVADWLAERAGRAEVVLTGGGAGVVAPLVRRPQRVVPNLVLEGLLCMAREEGMA